MLGGLFLIFFIPAVMFEGFDEVLEAFTPTDREHWFGILGAYLIGGFVGYFFLELAATAIAPSAENRATRKRLVALVVIPLSFAALHGIDEGLAWSFGMMLLVLVALDFFTESTEYPSVVLRPFIRKGPLGTMAARLLAPGWATGTLFHLTLLGLIILLSRLLDDSMWTGSGYGGYSDTWKDLGIVTGILYFPHFLVQIFHRRIKNRLATYILFSVLLFL